MHYFGACTGKKIGFEPIAGGCAPASTDRRCFQQATQQAQAAQQKQRRIVDPAIG
jgi:predicted RNase H-like nuclease